MLLKAKEIVIDNNSSYAGKRKFQNGSNSRRNRHINDAVCGWEARILYELES